MRQELARARREANFARYRPGQRAGHYESFFQRANHPSRPLAFWIRYTLFSPDKHPEWARGELWAVYFDGETGRHVAVKRDVPVADCAFGTAEFRVRVGEARLAPGRLDGSATAGGHIIAWDLGFRGQGEPLFLLPLGRYRAALPAAKSLVGGPLAVYSGSLRVDGAAIEVVDWVGSQNHNWGRRHTDRYAWGQVAGFDTHPESFLEAATARLRLGPLWNPPLTLLVLRHRGREIALNTVWQAVRAEGTLRDFTWRFRSETPAVRVEGTIAAAREDFIGLRYRNPPGGTKQCLNTKLAACRLVLTDKAAGGARPPEILFTRSRAAFEILTDEGEHGIAIRA